MFLCVFHSALLATIRLLKSFLSHINTTLPINLIYTSVQNPLLLFILYVHEHKHLDYVPKRKRKNNAYKINIFVHTMCSHIIRYVFPTITYHTLLLHTNIHIRNHNNGRKSKIISHNLCENTILFCIYTHSQHATNSLTKQRKKSIHSQCLSI